MLRSLRAAVPTLLLLAAGPAPAVLIDDFDDAASVSTDAGSPAGSVQTLPGSFLGDGRTLGALWTGGPNGVEATIASGSSLLGITLGDATNGVSAVEWVIGAGVDLSAGSTLDAIAIQIAFADQPVGLTLLASSPSGTGAFTVTTAGAISSATPVIFPFASFSGAVDFGSLTYLRLGFGFLSPGPATVELDFVGSTVVPEPSTGMLVLTGLLALRARRSARASAGRGRSGARARASWVRDRRSGSAARSAAS